MTLQKSFQDSNNSLPPLLYTLYLIYPAQQCSMATLALEFIHLVSLLGFFPLYSDFLILFYFIFFIESLSFFQREDNVLVSMEVNIKKKKNKWEKGKGNVIWTCHNKLTGKCRHNMCVRVLHFKNNFSLLLNLVLSYFCPSLKQQESFLWYKCFPWDLFPFFFYHPAVIFCSKCKQ